MSEHQQQASTGGQSHWCEGYVVKKSGSRRESLRPCLNLVRNDSDHCEAGHKNKIKPDARVDLCGSAKNDESVVATSMGCEDVVSEVPTLKRGTKVAVSLTGTVVGQPRPCLPGDESVVRVRIDGIPGGWYAVVPLRSVRKQT
jgi:hypothetical protein